MVLAADNVCHVGLFNTGVHIWRQEIAAINARVANRTRIPTGIKMSIARQHWIAAIYRNEPCVGGLRREAVKLLGLIPMIVLGRSPERDTARRPLARRSHVAKDRSAAEHVHSATRDP